MVLGADGIWENGIGEKRARLGTYLITRSFNILYLIKIKGLTSFSFFHFPRDTWMHEGLHIDLINNYACNINNYGMFKAVNKEQTHILVTVIILMTIMSQWLIRVITSCAYRTPPYELASENRDTYNIFKSKFLKIDYFSIVFACIPRNPRDLISSIIYSYLIINHQFRSAYLLTLINNIYHVIIFIYELFQYSTIYFGELMVLKLNWC